MLKAFNKLARWIFSGKKKEVNAGDLQSKQAQDLWKEVNKTLQNGFDKGIAHEVPYITKRDLQSNIYLFSGAKTFVELKELSSLLTDKDGSIKPFEKFWQEAQTIHKNYNKDYLEAEYIFATQSAMMASKWKEFEADGDRYNLQYRTANDDRVRDSHRLLHDITLPIDDPFWNYYFPPNGWRCRCTTVQVRKTKYTQSDSEKASELGEKATYTIGKGGNNTSEIFRFNPGKDKIIFPSHHPYVKAMNAKIVDAVKKVTEEWVEIKTTNNVVSVLREINKERSWFERGEVIIKTTTKKGVNGYTDMDGGVWLKKDKLDSVISGVNKLLGKKEVTASEADAFATLWHEITHNRNKIGLIRLTRKQTRNMELANEFVARNTLEEFYKAFGSDLQHKMFTLNRKSTGYNTMVRNYTLTIEKTGIDKKETIEIIKKHLFNEDYKTQEKGLIKGLQGAKSKEGKKINQTIIKKIIQQCDRLDEKEFKKYLDDLIR